MYIKNKIKKASSKKKKKYKRSKKTHTMHLQVRQRRRHQHEHAQLSPIPETLNYRLLAGEHPEHKSPYFFYVQLVSHMTIAAQSKRHDRSLRINQGRSKGPPSRDNTCLLKPQRRNGNRYMPPPVTKPNKTRPFQKKKNESRVVFVRSDRSLARAASRKTPPSSQLPKHTSAGLPATPCYPHYSKRFVGCTGCGGCVVV